MEWSFWVKKCRGLGNHRMHNLLKDAETVEVPCERTEVFANLNTPEEYRKHRR